LKEYRFEYLSSDEVEEYAKSGKPLLIPIGSVEQHGPHLPVGTDTIIAYEIALKVAKEIDAIVAPPIYYGNSMSMVGMYGTLSVSPQTLSAYILDLCKSASEIGFKRIIFINGHGGNVEAFDIIGHIARCMNLTIIRIDWWIIASQEISEIVGKIAHADEGETSVMLAVKPELVKMEKAVKDSKAREVYEKLTSGKPRNMPKIYVHFKTWTKTGVIGDATKATKEKGDRIVDAVVKNIVNFLKNLDKVSLELSP